MAGAGEDAKQPAAGSRRSSSRTGGTGGSSSRSGGTGKAPSRAAAAKSPSRTGSAAAKPSRSAGTASGSRASSGKASSGKAPSGKAPSGKAPSGKAPSGKAAAAGGSAEGAQPGGGLKLHHLRPAAGARKARTRVGRGEGSKGKTAGRGTKGTKARDQVPAAFEGGQMPLHRRIPQLRGFSNLRFKTTYQVVNTGRLAELYPKGGEVTPDDLVAKGAVRSGERVKVLATGDPGVVLQVTAHAFSASARDKITAAGGTVTQL
jgi:large subunit ribosomal protein L15